MGAGATYMTPMTMTAFQRRMEFLRNKRKAQHESLPNRLSCSTLVNECLRKAYCQHLGKWEPPEIVLAAMDFGTITHLLLQESLLEAHPDWQAEQKAVYWHTHPSGDSLQIVGKADMLTPDGGFEFKTIRALPETPKREHVRQAQFYMGAFERKEWVISYFEKNDYHPLVRERNFKVAFSKRTFDWMLNRAETLYNYIIKHEEPPSCTSMYCETCAPK